MNNQLTIDAAIEAIEQVAIHSRPEWFDKALSIVRHLCERQSKFTADDVWEQLDKTGWKTHENRALGAVMREAGSNGWCQVTPVHVVSRRKSCHGRPIPVWNSLLNAP